MRMSRMIRSWASLFSKCNPPRTKARRLNVDVLEDRTVPAVDITAFNVAAGTVTFTGDLNGTTSDTLILSQTVVGSEVRLSHNLIGAGGTGIYADATDIDPGAGVARLVLGTGTAPRITVNLGSNNDTLDLANSWTFLTPITVNAGDGTDRLLGPDANLNWTVTGAGQGTLGANVAFSGFETLQGGSGNDTFNVQANFNGTIRGDGGKDTFILHPGVTANTNIVGGAGEDVLDLSDFDDDLTVTITDVNANGVMGSTSLGTFAGIDTILGGSGEDTLVGPNLTATWDLDATPTLTVAGTTVSFVGFEDVQGGSASDTFNLGAGADVDINGGGGIDTVVGADVNQTWNVTGTRSGNVGSVDFANIETLQGGSANDNFQISANFAGMILGGAGNDNFDIGADVTAPVTVAGGAGTDTLDITDVVDALTVMITGVNANGFFGTSAVANFAGINAFVGADAEDTIVGPNMDATWDLDATPTLTVNGVSVSVAGFGTLQGGMADDTFNVMTDISADLRGGGGDDTFVIDSDATVDGIIRGGSGTDLLDYSDFTTDVRVNLNTGNATNVIGGIAGIENVRGGSGDDVLIGDSNNNTLIGGQGDDLLIGNGGDDTLIGNAGNDILVGGAGDDVLAGGAGMDILIGGFGVDLMHGGADDDVLIGGHVGLNTDELRDALDVWVRTDINFAQRVKLLRSTFEDAVTDDSLDILTGGDGTDWFVISKDDITVDKSGGDRQTKIK